MSQFADCAGRSSHADSCTGPALLTCGSCGAPRYCSRIHQRAHWLEHKEECERMAQQMMHAPALYDFPFLFTMEATQSVATGAATICSFLESRHLHGIGVWQAVCKCFYSGMAVNCKSWQLPSQMCPCRDVPHSGKDLFEDWLEYYTWRQLPLDSPVALLLHWPLTLYHALCILNAQMGISRLHFENGVHIHYLGPERELDLLEVFAEFLALLPGVHVHIDMIGPAVPTFRDREVLELTDYLKCCDSRCNCNMTATENLWESDMENKQTHLSRGKVTFKLWKGLYHEIHQNMDTSPHLIVAPNAGITAFASWKQTVELIARVKVPAFFTDYCEEAAYLGAQFISIVHSQPLSYDVEVNPFRQPFSIEEKLLNLPAFSNCFLLGVNLLPHLSSQQ